MRFRLTVWACLNFIAVSIGARAEVIDSADFEAPFDVLTDPDWTILAGQELGVSAVDASLSYNRGAISIDGGARALQIGTGLPSATTNNLVDWLFTPTTAGDVWFSYLMQTSEEASTSIPDFADARDFFQVHISEAGAEGQSLSVVLDNTSPVAGVDNDHTFRARVGSSGQNTTGFTDAGQLFYHAPAETHLIVGHIEQVGGEYETLSIYVNPGTPFVPETPTAMSTFAGVSPTTLAQLTVRISALEPDDFYLLDEIILGESYEDVVPVDANFLTGDFDSSGVLDEADFDILADNLFTGTTYQQGDFDFNGIVDLQDFIDFRIAFHAASAGAASVPEPSALVMAIVVAVSLGLMRRRSARV